MKFSILVAQYNNGRFFKDCYESINKQTYANWEVIIVDDKSTDDSVEIIQELIKNDDRFKLFENKENKGCGYTKAKCVEYATGEVCGFVDPDDGITKNAIELMINTHKQMPKVGMIYSILQYVDENFNYLGNYKNAKKIANFDMNFYNKSMEINHFVTFKKETYLKTEGINTNIHRAVDVDMYLKLYEQAEVYFLDEFLYLYRKHEGGISNFSNIEKATFWRWVVNIHTAERRRQNLEEKFLHTFVSRNKFNQIQGKYHSLKKFEKINNIYKKIKTLFS